jgi:hypothetical protein
MTIATPYKRVCDITCHLLLAYVPCVSVCVSPPVVARQRLRKYVAAATNTHATLEEFYASFSVRSVSPERKVAISSSQDFLLK